MIPISALYWQTLKLAVIYTLSDFGRWQPILLHEYICLLKWKSTMSSLNQSISVMWNNNESLYSNKRKYSNNKIRQSEVSPNLTTCHNGYMDTMHTLASEYCECKSCKEIELKQSSFTLCIQIHKLLVQCRSTAIYL